MPRLIRDQDVDTDLPTRVDHDLVSRSHIAFPLPGEATQVDAALLLFKLARIVGQTLEKLYTTTQRRGGIAKITRLQAELDMWERSLPTVEAGDVPETEPCSPSWSEDSLQAAFLRAANCVATVHIHRPALAFTTANAQFQKSLAVCCRASAGLIQVLSPGLKSLPTSGQDHCPDALLIALLYPNGAHMLWQAGLTILFARWKGHPSSAEGEDDDLVQQCVSALRQLHVTTEDTTQDILHCAEVLELLRAKTFNGTATSMIETEQLQWNVWDWPMASALELANTLEAMPLDLYMPDDIN